MGGKKPERKGGKKKKKKAEKCCKGRRKRRNREGEMTRAESPANMSFQQEMTTKRVEENRWRKESKIKPRRDKDK